MCIITAEELEAERRYWLNVTQTNIFARHTRPGWQGLACSLSIATQSAAAMILPLPVVPGSGEDALRFIDFSDFEDFFDHLASVCEPEIAYEESFDDLEYLGADEVLAVQEVGDYEASWVPTMADFTRLDPRFRLPEDVWRKIPDYSDYGFAVFQLKLTLSDGGEERENDVHPMAFEFPTRNDRRLYFPTVHVHVHDGDFHAEAGFYHRLYCQLPDARAAFIRARRALGAPAPDDDEPLMVEAFDGELVIDEADLLTWHYRTTRPAGEVLPVHRCHGLVDPDRAVHAMHLQGEFPNQDVWLS